MKKILLFCILFATMSAYAQGNKPFETVKSGSYRYELLKIVNSSFNAFSSQMNLQADGYFFRVHADSLRAEVPFVGKMTNPSPGLDTNAIRISSKIKELQVKETSNGKKLRVSFKAYSDFSKEMFDILLTVTESGSADLVFRSSKRDNITFYGTVYPLEPAK